MAQVPTGTNIFVASVFATALSFSAASNATECVLTMASTTGLANGDFVEVSSGWGRLNLRAARIKNVVLNTSITLEGMDTTSTTFFPVGAGTKKEHQASSWKPFIV